MGSSFRRGTSPEPVLETCEPQTQTALEPDPYHIVHLPDGSLWAVYYRSGDDFIVRFPELADFAILNRGGLVRCIPCPELDQATAEHLFLNQVRPLALGLQGRSVFHGAAVEIGGAAAVFLAESGRGKSTLAAAFARRGHPFLTDDGLLVEPDGDGYVVLPSAPGLRLHSDSAQAVVGRAAMAAPSASYASKVKFLAGDSLPFCTRPLPLRVAYLLGDGSAPETTFRRISGAEAILGWVEHAFLLEFRNHQLLSDHFERTAELARRIPLFRLDYPRRYDLMDDLVRHVVAHSAELETS